MDSDINPLDPDDFLGSVEVPLGEVRSLSLGGVGAARVRGVRASLAPSVSSPAPRRAAARCAQLAPGVETDKWLQLMPENQSPWEQREKTLRKGKLPPDAVKEVVKAEKTKSAGFVHVKLTYHHSTLGEALSWCWEPQKKRKHNPFKFVIINPQVKYVKRHLQPCIDFASAVAGAPNWKDTRVSCQVFGCMILWARLVDYTYEIMHMLIAAWILHGLYTHKIRPPSRPASSTNGVEADTNGDQSPTRGAGGSPRNGALPASEDEKADNGSDVELEEAAKSARTPRSTRSPRKERSLPARSPRARSPGPQRNGSDSDIAATDDSLVTTPSRRRGLGKLLAEGASAAKTLQDAAAEGTIIQAAGRETITSFCDALADGIDQLMQAERLYQWAKPEESAGALCALMMSCVVHHYVPFRDLFTLAVVGAFSVNTWKFKLVERLGTFGPKGLQAALKQRRATRTASKEAADAVDIRISEQFRQARSMRGAVTPRAREVALRYALLSLLAQAIQNVFRDADSDGSGEMDIQELEQALITLGTRPSKLELKHIVRKYDVDESGKLSVDEARARTRASRPLSLSLSLSPPPSLNENAVARSSRACAWR